MSKRSLNDRANESYSDSSPFAQDRHDCFDFDYDTTVHYLLFSHVLMAGFLGGNIGDASMGGAGGTTTL